MLGKLFNVYPTHGCPLLMSHLITPFWAVRFMYTRIPRTSSLLATGSWRHFSSCPCGGCTSAPLASRVSRAFQEFWVRAVERRSPHAPRDPPQTPTPVTVSYLVLSSLRVNWIYLRKIKVFVAFLKGKKNVENTYSRTSS